MQTKPKSTTKKKVGNNAAPRQGSAGYWFYLILFIFFIPFVFVSAYFMILFAMLSQKIFFLGIPVGFAIAYSFLKKVNSRLKRMSVNEYHQCFKQSGNAIHINSMPKKNSVGYWCYIGFCTFIIPFIFITIPVTAIFFSISPKLLLTGPVVGLGIAYLYAKYKHHKISSLSPKAYKAYFKKRIERCMTPRHPGSDTLSTSQHHHAINDFPKRHMDWDETTLIPHTVYHTSQPIMPVEDNLNNTGWNPYDPTKTEYWTSGPGHSHHFTDY